MSSRCTVAVLRFGWLLPERLSPRDCPAVAVSARCCSPFRTARRWRAAPLSVASHAAASRSAPVSRKRTVIFTFRRNPNPPLTKQCSAWCFTGQGRNVILQHVREIHFPVTPLEASFPAACSLVCSSTPAYIAKLPSQSRESPLPTSAVEMPSLNLKKWWGTWWEGRANPRELRCMQCTWMTARGRASSHPFPVLI